MHLDSLVAPLVEQASAILDAATALFLVGHRADSAVRKKGNDFATEVDLAIERQVVAALVAATGIEVHGEEFGGPAVDSRWVWVLDPIDGTINYAAGSPLAAILLGLLHDGVPVAGLTWMPFTDQRYTAVAGGPLIKNGVPQPPLADAELANVLVGVGTFSADSRGQFPGRYRLAVLEKLSRVSSRLRMHGSTGIDLVFVADGILGGAISFGGHVWDHAAGVALVRAAGGVVTDLAGQPWTPASRSALAGPPRVHAQILEILGSIGNQRTTEMYADRDLPGAGGLAVRVIPCLDVDDGRVVKGVNFENLRDAGDPVELAAVYDAEGADELTFLDVTASSSGRATMLEVVRRTAEQVFIPLTVGGGVRTVADVDSLLRAGADKVAVNTAAIACPDLLADMARQFGSQCIVLSVDARTVPVGSAPTPSGWEVTTHGGRRGTGMDAVQWAARGADLGVGEILLNSMDADGTKAGFDLALLRAVRAAVTVPVIASGGAGAVEHFAPAVAAGADAVLAASVFHFRELTIGQVKAALAAEGITVR